MAMHRVPFFTLQSLQRLSTSAVRNIRHSSSSSKSPINPPKEKRKWTRAQIKDIQRYKKETQLGFGPYNKSKKSKNKNENPNKENSAGSKVYNGEVDVDLTDDDLKLCVEEDLVMGRERSEGVRENQKDVSTISSSDENINEVCDDERTEAVHNADKSDPQSEQDEDFVDYFDAPSKVSPPSSQVYPRKKMKFKPLPTTPLIVNSFPRDFPSSKSPIDNILVFPMLPGDKTIPDIPRDVLTSSKGKLPSVTKILSATMTPESKAALAMWETKMIEQLGLDGFNELKAETFKRGHQLHECVEQRLLGTEESDLEITDLIEGHWKSMSAVFKDIGQVDFTEARVNHSILNYTGIFDCVAYYKNSLCLIDWKTSKKQKARLQFTYDNPVQLAAYIGALNHDPEYTVPVHRAVLVIAYEDGSPAHVYQLSPRQLSSYWRKWTKRLHQFHHTAQLTSSE